MDIFEKIEKINEKGYLIEYTTIDQCENYSKSEIEKGDIKPITYTVIVSKIGEYKELYAESCDRIKDCLEAGIKYVEENLVNLKK